MKHRKNCESCPSQFTWKVKFKSACLVCSLWLVFPVCPGCPVCPGDHVDQDDQLTIVTVTSIMFVSTMMAILTITMIALATMMKNLDHDDNFEHDDNFDHDDQLDHDDYLDHIDVKEVWGCTEASSMLYEEVGGCTQASWRFLIPHNTQLACEKKLKVIWPDVCCARIAVSITLNDGWGMNEWISIFFNHSPICTVFGVQLYNNSACILSRNH